MEGVLYKPIVRSLMYAMMATRANFAFAVITVSQFILRRFTTLDGCEMYHEAFWTSNYA